MTFIPELGDLWLMLWVFAALFLALGGLAFWLNNGHHPDPRRRVLLPMLAYFFALLALMGAMGAFWSIFKYPTVTVENDRMTIGETDYQMPRTNNVRFESPGGGSDRLLLVQTADRRTWAFPGDRYDVNALYRALRKE